MRRFLVSAVLCTGITSALSAQTVPLPRFGITAGVNLSTIGGDSISGAKNKTGFFVGGTVIVPMGSGFSFNPELTYSLKGAKFSDQGTNGSFKLNYLELPILLRYDFAVAGTTRPFLLAGPALGFQTSCKISGEDQSTTVTFGCKDFFDQLGAPIDVKKFDTGAMFGGGVAFDVSGHTMSLGLRYNLGLNDVFSDTDAKNRVLSFVGTYEWRK